MHDISKEIYLRQDEILSNITTESIEVYLFLKDEYAKSNIGNNTVFQFVFRSYYRLDGAGLGDDLKKRFFELLERKENNLVKILRELSAIPTLQGRNAVHFSFSTKLLHTLNDSNPIFDSRVAKAIGRSVTGTDTDTRIESCIALYAHLKQIQHDLLEEEEIKKVIQKFKIKFDINQKISDAKALDFIIWTLGKLKS